MQTIPAVVEYPVLRCLVLLSFPAMLITTCTNQVKNKISSKSDLNFLMFFINPIIQRNNQHSAMLKLQQPLKTQLPHETYSNCVGFLKIEITLHAEKSVRNLVNPNQIWIVITLFRQIRESIDFRLIGEFRLVLNLSEKW